MTGGTVGLDFGMNDDEFDAEHESGVSIVDSIPTNYAIEQFSFVITEDYIDALRSGKYIEVRVGSLGTNEYQAYLSLKPKQD